MRLPDLRWPAPLREPLAIRHVNVVTMADPSVLPGRTVIIEDGRITTVARASEIDTADMPTLDGRGRYLLPGLADMHVHVWHPADAALYLAHGITTVRNMSGTPWHLGLIERHRQGESAGPHIVTTSPIIEGRRPVLPGWPVAADAATATAVAERCLDRGFTQLKVYNGVPGAALRAIGAVATRRGVRMVGHCPIEVSYEAAIDAGLTCFEHLVGIWRGHLRPGAEEQGQRGNIDLAVLKLAADDLDFDAIWGLAGRLAEQQIWNCPTLVAMHHMYTPQAVGLADPATQRWLAAVPPLALAVWARLDPLNSIERFGARSLDEWQAASTARNETFGRVVAALHAAGAPLLIGTDAPVRFVYPGWSAIEELRLFVAAGLSPYAALRCATTEAARFLGEAADWGTIEPGRRADLLLLDANPLDDLNPLDRPAAVVTNGYLLDRAALDDLIEQAHALTTTLPAALAEVAPYASTDPNARSGVWQERDGDLASGRLAWRQTPQPGGSWHVEEAAVFERGDIFSPGGPQRRYWSARLAADGTLASANWTHQTYGGLTIGSVEHLAGGYAVSLTAADGTLIEQSLTTEPLLVDDRLAPSALAFALSELGGSAAGTGRQVLEFDGELARSAPLTLGSATAGPPTEATTIQRRVVTIEHADSSTTLTYHLAPTGELLVIGDRHRELRPISAGTPLTVATANVQR